MNCKPGDMAVYVGIDPRQYGMIVRCVSIHPFGTYFMGEPCWITEPALMQIDHAKKAEGICDSALRPIRDPGEDAQDETLSWLPAPRRDEVVA